MSAKHTTGPWIYAIPGDSFVASDNGLICRRPAVSGGGSAPNNWEANARLIAAAPDLLIFAQNVSNGVIVPELMTHEGLIEVLLGWQKTARAAIAKAIGDTK